MRFRSVISIHGMSVTMRQRRALKRGGRAAKVTLHFDVALDGPDDLDLVALDEALTRFGESYPRQARVVELRFLAGLSVEEAAEVLDVSTRTVIFDWQMARAWLKRALHTADAGE